MTSPSAWATALIFITALSWFFYRYIAPEKWREWAGAGLVQAFIIALYAEMYGFPLTIYLLVRVFGIDVSPTESGNLWSSLFDLGETPMLIAMTLGYTVAIGGIAILIEGWREVYHARREGRLATDGLYGVVRHPQYLGLLMAIFGEGVIHWPTIFSVSLFPVIALAYFVLAKKEEQEMERQFGEHYRAYAREVPMFFPSRRRTVARPRHV